MTVKCGYVSGLVSWYDTGAAERGLRLSRPRPEGAAPWAIMRGLAKPDVSGEY